MAFDYGALTVGQVLLEGYLASLEPLERAELERVLRAMADGFLAQLTLDLRIRVEPADGPPEAGEVLLTARFRAMALGRYRVDRSRDAQLIADLEWARGGAVTDVVRVRTRVPASSTHPTELGRMQVAAEEAASLAADFFWAEQRR